MIDLTKHLKEFFCTYLRDQRALSPNTIKSYRDTFKILIAYLGAKRRTSGPLMLADLDAKTILAFLQHLEDQQQGRGNSANTRNQRLAAIQSFFKYLSIHCPSIENQARRVMGIPVKKVPPTEEDFLTRQELDALLAQPRMDSSDGVRDLALLNFLYNTGARASEAAEARLSWFDLPARIVTITGKGNKTRLTPLWPATVRLLNLYLEHRRKSKPEAAAYFFINQRGLPFTRFGIRNIVKRYVQRAVRQCPSLLKKRISVHHIRHTTATHLTQAGVDPTVLKDWIGHKMLSSGDRYRHADLNQKRRILEQFAPPNYVTSLEAPEKAVSEAGQLDWLEDL
jgi:site-specific recombinase XerD